MRYVRTASGGQRLRVSIAGLHGLGFAFQVTIGLAADVHRDAVQSAARDGPGSGAGGVSA